MSIVIFILLCPARLNYLFQSVWGLGSKHCANTCINNVPQVTYLFLYMMHVFIKMKKGDSIQVFYSGRKFSSKWENLYLITLFFSYLQDSDLGYWCFCFEEYFLLSFFFLIIGLGLQKNQKDTYFVSSLEHSLLRHCHA